MANDEVRIKIKIDSNSQELVLMKQQVQELGKSFTDADSFANTFMKRINLAGHIYAGFQILNNTLGDLGRRGLEVNKEFQKLTNSLTMSSAVMMSNNDIYGNAISITEKYKIAQMDAAKTTEMLQKININTPHTMKETTQIYDSMYFGMKKVGASTSDMVEITEKLSIAAGNKVGFDAFLSAMDGISTGTVEANSEMGRFLSSVGLSNEEIKNSSNVVQLFKDKLSGFEAIQDFETKMSNLTNSTDMFAKNLMKIPFDYLESKLPTTAKMFDDWAKSINEINIYLSNASNLNTYDELMNKQYQLLGQIKEVKNDKFMWDSDQKEKLASLNGELETVFKKLSEIRALEDKAKIIETKFDSKPIDDLVEKTLNPYGAKLDEINKKWQKNFEDMQKNGKDTSKLYQAWVKELDDLNKEEADKKEKALKENEKLLKEQQKSAETLNKALLDISQIGMSEYDKAIISITEKTNEWIKAGVSENDILVAKNKLLAELNSKTLFESQKEDLSYYERKVQLLDDSISKELELQGVSYANKILEIENSTKSIAQKDKLIAKETELFNLTVQSMNYKYNTEFQDTMSNFYDDMLDSQLALNNAVYDFGSGFDGVSSKIGNVSKSIAAMSSLELTNKKEASKLDKKYIEQFNKYAGKVEETSELAKQYEIDTGILKEQNIQAQIAGYANIAGAMSGMFEQGSRDAAAFQVVESGLALVAGVRAVISQGSGDPYTAFARMATMAATISSLLSSIGIAFGMNKATTSSDAFSAMTSNNGTDSVLGDSKAQSESITNSLNILQDFAQPQFETLVQMNKSLTSIDQKIGGVSSLLIQNESFALGKNFTGFDTGYKNNVSLGGLEKLNLFDALTGSKIMGGIINKTLGGLFGKTSVSQSLTDSGIYFADALLTSAINEFNGQAYQTIATVTSKKSWISKSSSTSINSYFNELDNETERQFSLVLKNLYSTVLTAGTALDSATNDTAKSLENFIVSIGKVSLNGKTGSEIQEALSSVFGKVGDDISKTAFPLLSWFQQVGEGMFETLTRVATGMEEAEFYISRLGRQFADVTYTAIGNKQGNVGFEALLLSIEKVESATYPLNNNLLDVIENLDGTAEELYSVYTSLDDLRDRLIFLNQDAQGVSKSMLFGAGGADVLVDGFNSFFENFLSENEQLTYKTQQLIKDFNNLGVALPASKDSFKALLSGLDLTSESGQKLYGELIALSESFADVANETASSIEELSSSLKDLSNSAFDNFIQSLDSVGQSLNSIKQTALGFINGFSTSSSTTLKEQLISYNKLRQEFSLNFSDDGIIKAGVNSDTVSGLYSQITSLAGNISQKDNYLKDSLISQISSDLIKFNSAEDILKVNIVDGLGALLGLNNSQLAQLQLVASDGKITNNELSSISGLTQIQKDGITEFAKNSIYFSTEDTLSSLNQYTKKQLEILQQSQANETANLSSQTFSYGDYVGKQEQIDIATKLGVSYDTAKPLIEQLQGLSVLNPTEIKSGIEKILGFTTNGIDYNSTTMGYLEKLNTYLDPQVTLSMSEVKEQAATNRTTQMNEAQEIINSLQQTIEPTRATIYSKYNPTILSLQQQIATLESYKYGQSAGTIGYINQNQNSLRSSISSYTEQLNNELNTTIGGIMTQINTKKLLIEQLKGYSTGGYTGDIPINAIAGYVHGGEHVLDSNVTSQINSIGSVADMVNQYTNTNFYQKMNNTFMEMKKEISNLVKITMDQANEIKKLRKETEFKGAV